MSLSPLQNPTPPLVLASASAGRRALLEAAGLAFAVVPAVVDETALLDGLRAEGAAAGDAATVLAETKALQVAARLPADAIVLGCDQILEIDGSWLEKPGSRATAASQLAALQGRTHRLRSAVVAARGGSRIWQHLGEARLTMRPLSAATIERYLDAEGPAVLGCVGAYRIEGLGAQLFDRIEGDWFSIVGLPLLAVLGFLREQGVLVR